VILIPTAIPVQDRRRAIRRDACTAVRDEAILSERGRLAASSLYIERAD
jgi:hypothetical protein